jgi:DNA-binding response OmpR family regulator
LRQQENIKNTYFILMSAKRDMDWILAAKKARADGLITKPFTPEMLKQKISQLGATHALAWPAPSQAGPPDHIWGGQSTRHKPRGCGLRNAAPRKYR